MAGDEKKAKTSPAAIKEAAPKGKETATKDKAASGADTSKVEGETAAASPSNYSRGEGQKPVTQAYKDNWNAIFGKKKKKR
jgi:hypothetical protein